MGRRRKVIDKDDLSEDYCFVCKDGGEIRVCDFKACLKSYHPHCVDKDDSFLESDEQWTCDWHLCYNCRKSSAFKCFCCPYSSCRSCFGGSELVKVKGTKGFCINCLRLAKLIEENVDVDSDGDMVDFADTDTYEFLFKDYWEIVKEKERLALANLQAADDLLKRGEKFNNLSDLDDNFEDREEGAGSDDDCGEEVMPSKDFFSKQNSMNMVKEKSKSKKMTYIGWASKELIEFLIFVGKDTQQPLDQHDVYELVKDYIQSNNLLRHDKKKKRYVFCDAKLLSLFRRKKVSFFKVYSLLEKHFAENNDSDDESFSLEEDENAKYAKKQRIDTSFSKQKIQRGYFIEAALQPPKKCFAAIIDANIKLIYLKRSLIVELMKDVKTFETKVVGCFVRRKSDPKDNYGHGPLPKMYHLNQITGVLKASEEYKLGDINTNIVLYVSNYCKAVQLSMLSDDNFEEEECEDLRKLVKEGLFKRPSVDELKEKIRTVHEDMVKHSIKKELLKLEKLIERANEKGWRKELFDYMERKKLLNKPEEIMRLMKELPDVVVDIESEATEGAHSYVPAKNVSNLKAEVQGGIGSLKPSVTTTTKQIVLEEQTGDGAPRTSPGDAANLMITYKKPQVSDVVPYSSQMDAPSSEKISVEEKIEVAGHDSNDSKTNADTVAVKIDEDEASLKRPDVVHIIDLEVAPENPVVGNGGSEEMIWNYLDPSGNVQGPFSIRLLEYWMKEGFFDEDFRIWRASQSQEDAIPLGVALSSLQLP